MIGWINILKCEHYWRELRSSPLGKKRRNREWRNSFAGFDYYVYEVHSDCLKCGKQKKEKKYELVKQ